MDINKKLEKSLIYIQAAAIICPMLFHLLYDGMKSAGFIFVAIIGAFLCLVKYLLTDKVTDATVIRVVMAFRVMDLLLMLITISVYPNDLLYAFLFPVSMIISSYSSIMKKKREAFFVALSMLVYILGGVFNYLIYRFDYAHMASFIFTGLILFFILRLLSLSIREYEDRINRLLSSNSGLNRKVAEFYNLQQLQSAIKSIHNTDELVKTVNDMIIGVVGPTYSSIVLHSSALTDESDSSFIMAATNISESEQDAFLSQDCVLLWDKMSMNGSIGNAGEEMILSDARIASYIAVPLTIKSERLGMIVVFHYIPNALNTEHLKLVRLVAGDLSIALENTGLYEKMEKMATLDGLTMVYNRMFFQTALDEEFRKAYSKYPISIAICDADLFKNINDSYGHIFGDYVLKVIAERLQQSLRKGDIIARYGGEEFVIILPGCSSEDAYIIIERLRKAVSNEPIYDKQYSVQATISFGIASYPEHGTTSRKVLSAADHALYMAKNEGRNCTRLALAQN